MLPRPVAGSFSRWERREGVKGAGKSEGAVGPGGSPAGRLPGPAKRRESVQRDLSASSKAAPAFLIILALTCPCPPALPLSPQP